MGSPMRTLGFRTHVLLAIAGAIGVLYSLTRPWYAAAPPPVKEDDAGIGDIHGPLNQFFDGAKRWASGGDGVSGWQALDHWGQMIAAMAVVAVLGSLLCCAAAPAGARPRPRALRLARRARDHRVEARRPAGRQRRLGAARRRADRPACSRSCSSPARPASPTRRCAARSRSARTRRRPRRRPTSPASERR